MTNTPRANATLVDCLGSALRSAKHGFECVPGLLKRVLAEESWRRFETQRGDLVEYGDHQFAAFVARGPLKGLGGSIDLLWRLVEDDPEAAELLGQVLADGPGRPGRIPIDDPEAAADTLRKHMSPDDLRQLVLLLAATPATTGPDHRPPAGRTAP